MRCTSQQLVVFFLTFFGYATLHAMRTSWSYSKELLQGRHHDLYISNHTMGLVDTVFMLSYAIGLAFIGPLGDHYNLRRFISAGYYTCGLAFLVFPACFHFFGIGSVAILIISRVVNGLGESTGMPGSMGILSKWFTGGHQGLILGLWTGCLCFGNISGLISSTIITQYLHLRWEYNFFFNGIMTLIMATLILFFLKKEPYKQDNIQQTIQPTIQQEQNTEGPKYNFITCFTIPRVLPYVISYSCLKASIYGLLFWLPKYIYQRGMKENSGYIPSMLDLGTFIGAILIGYLGDRLKKRSLFLAPFIFFSSIMMLIATLFLSNNPLPYFLVIFLIGMGLGGPYNIIGTNFLNLGTIIAIDLASQDAVKGNKKIISTITAVVDACGALFAAFTQLLLAHISHRWIFTLFTIYTLCAGAVLVPLTIEDYKIYRYQNAISKQSKNNSKH